MDLEKLRRDSLLDLLPPRRSRRQQFREDDKVAVLAVDDPADGRLILEVQNPVDEHDQRVSLAPTQEAAESLRQQRQLARTGVALPDHLHLAAGDLCDGKEGLVVLAQDQLVVLRELGERRRGVRSQVCW